MGITRYMWIVAGLWAVAACGGARAGDAAWPQWRGPTLDGKAAGQSPPTTWSEKEHVVWKTEVVGRGHASPIIVGDLVITATADEDAQALLLVAFDRATGKPAWTTQVHKGGYIHRHEKNSHASQTPAWDGQRLFTVFAVQDALWVTATGLDGKIAWQKKVAPFVSMHGYGSSPLIYGSVLIINADNNGPGSLIAIDRATGEKVWETKRSDQPSFAAPIIADVAGRKQLLMHGHLRVTSYDPDTGKELWWASGTASVAGNTIAAGEKMVYASGGFPQRELMCIAADGSGDVTNTHVVWRNKERFVAPYVPSPLLSDGLLYTVSDGGLLGCFDAATGKAQYTQKMAGKFTSSPMLAGGHIYVADETGTTYVLKPGPKFSLVAQNRLDAGQYASPAFADNRIYLRTLTHLYCIGDRATAGK